MKKVLFYIASLFSLLFANIETKAQGNNLEFDRAIFYEYGPVNADINGTPHSLLSVNLVVSPNKILKITSATCSNNNPSTGATGTINYGTDKANYCNLTINDVIIQGEVFLPEGTYTIEITDGTTAMNASSFYKGYISGVQYNIVQ